MSGIFARAMIGVVASASPELTGPQMRVDFELADHFLGGVDGLGRIALGVAGHDLDLAALDAARRVDGVDREGHAAIEPTVGAELGPVIAASQPILIGSDWAIAGFGNENAAAPSAPVVPNKTSRRETPMNSSQFYTFPAPVVAAGARCIRFRLVAETGLLKSNLSLMWTSCPELPLRRRDMAVIRQLSYDAARSAQSSRIRRYPRPRPAAGRRSPRH